VRPHRRLVALAIASAVLASALWAAAMLLAFPISKVMLEQQSLGEYVAAELANAQDSAARYAARLEVLERQQADWPAAGRTTDPEYLKLLREQARCQAQLSDARRREWRSLQWQAWVIPWFPDDRFNTLACLLAGLLALTVLHGGAVYAQEICIGRVVQAALRTLRTRLFHRSLRFDVQSLGVEGVPSLMSRFTNDLTGIAFGLTLLGGKIVLEPMKIAACLVSAFAVNWRLTLLSLLCVPLGALLFRTFGKGIKRASRRQMETVARLYAVLQETLASFRLVAAYGHGRRHRLQLFRENREYYRKAMQINRIDALVNPTVELLGVTAACLAILPGAFLILRHKTAIFGIQLTAAPMDLAELALLYSLLGGAIDPARKLSTVFSKVKKSFAACDRVFDWMDRETAVSAAGAITPARHQQSVEFDRVTFRYPAGDDGADRAAALDDVSLRIEFGEVVAIVGGNGSGKSTLVGLVPRFYDPRHGAVRIDGIDVRELSLRDLREEIGWVPQEPMLFDGTVAENIAHGCHSASRSAIEDVARRAYVAQFTADWPQGLDTPIGEKGSRLSGGQRQRVALARAMLRDPAILVLDEATSAIDAQSETLIQQTLKEFSRGRTTLLITHAMTPQLLEFVTKVVVLDRGRLVGVGRHEQLLASCPPYASLYAAQSARRAA
jgi:subfamily B ATP-binding cassette protein MsbA